ncbi:arabinose efflux permease family protein [Caldisphaera lagunensis DSM 15908]|uniref:Arabinose efflux permease family protein n=1 Tax=Caldisphaera lagunensis (strain DSM 15908 / JCM 11604 / ANMR 0165 / IC-154) TaxID=1056495 RepID=L0AAX1_CALLD|nr:MFS transporter [Caldisphaera lagunensis]AFZ70564.1 arabinose efflux permease family protein [Caldisphaera lagunensis DSM 15908]
MDNKRRALIYTSLGHFLNDSFIIVFSILIAYYLDMKISASYLGVMGALINILSGLISMWVGIIADRRGVHAKLMLLGYALIGLSIILYAISFLYIKYDLIFIAIASIFLGTGLSFYHPLGGSILQHTFDPRDSPRALGINGSFGSIGRALFPVILVFTINYLGGPLALSIIGIYTFIIGFIVFYGLNPIKIEYKINKDSTNKVSLSSYYYVLIPLAIVIFIRAMFISGVQTYVPTYLSHLLNSKEIMSIILTVSYATAIFGQPYFGKLTGDIGGRKVVFLTTILATLFYIGFLLIKIKIIMALMFVLFSLFAFSGFPVLLGYVGQIVDRNVSAQANSLIWGIGNTIGGAIGILIGGLLLNKIGFYNDMLIFAIIAVISTALLPLIPSKRK